MEDKIEKKQNGFIEFLKWVEMVLIAIIITFFIRGFIIEPVIVVGISMEDTLLNEQRLIIYKFGYFFKEPERGDIIVLQYQQGLLSKLPFLDKFDFLNRVLPSIMEIDYIKRVIGIPGDEIDIQDGHLFVNGEKLNEEYVKGDTHKYLLDFPITVPQDSVFVLGDNRQNSRDSRIIGFIEYKRIRGKAIFRIYPFKNMGTIK